MMLCEVGSNLYFFQTIGRDVKAQILNNLIMINKKNKNGKK